jgi:hypothetical protein
VADIEFDDLLSAMGAEGLKPDKGTMLRVFRRLANPQGCEHCGQHVKVAVMKRGKQYTACCDHYEAAPKEK